MLLRPVVPVLSALLAASACGKPAARPTTPTAPAAPARDEWMTTFELKGYELSGGEYWPYVGEVDIDYPKEVLWGFYPKQGVLAPGEDEPNIASASPAAIDCAERAYAALKEFIDSDSPLLREIVAGGADNGISNKFYLWTNDYTRAATPYPPGMRPARFWYWHRKTPDPTRPPGFWKWESSVDQQGICHIPNPIQIGEYLATTKAELAANPTGKPH